MTVAPTARGSAHRVVIVDDSRVVVDLVRLILSGAGIQARGFAEAFGCEDAMREYAPTVILLDVGMRGLGEVGLRERVLTFRRLTGAHIVLHSARERDELEILGRQVGADRVLCKSGDPSHLLEMLAELEPASEP